MYLINEWLYKVFHDIFNENASERAIYRDQPHPNNPRISITELEYLLTLLYTLGVCNKR